MGIIRLNNRQTDTMGDALHYLLNPKRMVVATVLILGIYAVWHLFLDESSAGRSTYGSIAQDDFENLAVWTLSPTKKVIGTTELYYMVPNSAKGILIFFHGCNHGGQDFFNLPEDRRVAFVALQRGLAVVSVSSQNQNSGCWSKSLDLQELPQVLDIWRKSVNLSPKLPRMGMGASSGASFLFQAYSVLRFRSMASYIMWKSFADLSHPSTLPATAFVHMPRDPKSVDATPKQYEALLDLGVPTKLLEVHPRALTPYRCGRRIPELGLDRCTKILDLARRDHSDLIDSEYNVLESHTGGLWDETFVASKLDDKDLELEGDQKRGKRKRKLKKKKKMSLSDVAFDSHSWAWAALREEVAVSYAKHEMTSEHVHEVLDFLMKYAGIE